MHKSIAYKARLAHGLYNLNTKLHRLILKYINYDMKHEAQKLYVLAIDVLALLKEVSQPFNFASHLAKGNSLLVGEGNLSFALSLIRTTMSKPRNMIAATFEKETELSIDAKANALLLRKHGVSVLHGIDATKLKQNFNEQLFDNIVFQFPNAGSRESIEGHNPNFVLVRDFLISANDQLSYNGTVLISVIDSPYYAGVFQLEKAASIAGFVISDIYPFDPLQFEGYEHIMTHQEGSAIDKNDKCATWIFTKK